MNRGLEHCTGDGDQTIPKKKKCQKAKWLSEEALQITEKRREVKGKGEKERYIHLNAEFQSINSLALIFLYSPAITSITTTGKTIALTRWTFVRKHHYKQS